MTPRHRVHRLRFRKAAGAALALWPVLAGLTACTFSEPVAGGSSEVDNPVVVLVNDAGTRVNVSGSLGLYLSTQSPAVTPSPVLELQLNGADSIVLSPRTFALALTAAGYTDSVRSLNLHLQAGDSAGAFLQGVTYDPVTGSFSDAGGDPDPLLKLTVSPLLRVEAVITGGQDSTGVHRLIIPGSPFQTVLVDSTFAFTGLPPGVFPLHLIRPDGRELPLPESLAASAPRPLHVRPDTTPVFRPGPPPPAITVNAGPDRTASSGSQITLMADVAGVSPSDKRLAVLWKQLPPANPGSVPATIDHPTALTTNVSFPRTGAYTFTVTVVLGNQQVTDTVTIGVQASRSAPVFIEPGPGDTLRIQHGIRVVWWEDPAYDWWKGPPAPLTLEFSGDSGVTWGRPPWDTSYPPQSQDILSGSGFNQRYWFPSATAGAGQREHAFLRFTRNGEVVAVSGRFVLRGL